MERRPRSSICRDPRANIRLMKASAQWLRSLLPQLGDDDVVVSAIEHGGLHVNSVTPLRGSLDTLGLAGEAPEDAPLEDSLPPAFDTIIEIADTRRSDLMGHVGIAREIAAVMRWPFEPPGVDAPAKVAQGTIESRIDVHVRDALRCAHFGVIAIEQLEVGRSPLWLRVRLRALGCEVRNDVADAATLAMLELGVPVLPFDLDRVDGAIEVRRARPGETLAVRTQALALCEDDLVLADASGPLALAGVAAGTRAKVTTDTRRAVFAAGSYDPDSVERSMARLGEMTELARRHRLGIDRVAVVEALAQTGAIATRLAKGAAVPGALHVFDEPWHAEPIEVSGRELAGRLGPQWNMQQVLEMLGRLGFESAVLHSGSGDGVQVMVPSFRQDIQTAQDVVGELSRLRLAWSWPGDG